MRYISSCSHAGARNSPSLYISLTPGRSVGVYVTHAKLALGCHPQKKTLTHFPSSKKNSLKKDPLPEANPRTARTGWWWFCYYAATPHAQLATSHSLPKHQPPFKKWKDSSFDHSNARARKIGSTCTSDDVPNSTEEQEFQQSRLRRPVEEAERAERA